VPCQNAIREEKSSFALSENASSYDHGYIHSRRRLCIHQITQKQQGMPRPRIHLTAT